MIPPISLMRFVSVHQHSEMAKAGGCRGLLVQPLHPSDGRGHLEGQRRSGERNLRVQQGPVLHPVLPHVEASTQVTK